MDIREYSYILKIAECGNLTRAAEELYIAQSALSMYIRNLEQRLGIKLYHKVGRQLVFTPEGERYLYYAKQITAIDRSVKQEFEEMKLGKSGFARLGVSLSRAPFLIPKFLFTLKQEYPQIDLQISEGSNLELRKMLESREIDLAVISLSDNFSFPYTRLFQEEIVIYAPSKFNYGRFAETREGCRYPYLPLDKILKEPFIVLRQGHYLRQISDTIFSSYDVSPNIVYETHSAQLAFELTAAGLGFTVMYDSMPLFGKDAEIQRYSFGSVRNNTMILAYHSLRDASPAVRAVHDVLVKTAPLSIIH